MLKGVLNKGYVKYSLALVILILFIASLTLYTGEGTGKGMKDTDLVSETKPPEVMDFDEILEETEDETEEPPEDETPEPEVTGSSGGMFVGGGSSNGESSGGGGGSVQCKPPTHTECDFKNEICIVVEGEGKDECTKDEDCYCDPKTPGYWKNHLDEAGGLLVYQSVGRGSLTEEWSVDANEIAPGKLRVGGFRGSGSIIPAGSTGSLAIVNFTVIGSGYEGDVDICITNYMDDVSGMAPEPYCMSSCQTSIAPSSEIYITCSPDSGGIGTTVTVITSIDGNTDVMDAFGLDLTYGKGLLTCVHDNYDVFDDVETWDNITYVLECSGNCSNMFNKLKKFLLATMFNLCASYFDLDDVYDGKTVEYWVNNSIEEVENGESEFDEYYKNALDNMLNGQLECNPDRHTVCNYDEFKCDLVLGEGEDECVTYDDCAEHTECNYERDACVVVNGEGENECETYDDCTHTECNYEEEVCLTLESPGDDECETDDDCVEECIPPFLAVDKEADPTELICEEETTITLKIEGDGEVCDGFYPVDVVLVFDNSGSMDDDGYDDNISDWQPIGDAKIAAKTFIDLLGSNDKAGLVSFNTIATLEEGLTFDKNAVKSAINGMSAGGWTNMSQGIDYGTGELVDNGRADTPWIEILLSDGNNNCGTNEPPADCHQKVFDSAQEAADNGIVIYTIALGENANQSLMEQVADMTGGKFYYAPGSEDLEEIYEEIAEDVTTIAGTNVVVVDYLPNYVELNESTLPPECVYKDSERKITCEVGTININETASFSFNVYLHESGYLLTNVYPDSGVSYINYNLTSQFEPFPKTYVTVECEYTICNYVNLTCDTVFGVGDDQCETFEDCPQHTECDYQHEVCSIVEGSGENQCLTWEDCLHTECCDMACVVVSSQGIDECSTDEDCYYYACEEMSCVAFAGFEDDECVDDMDCTDYVCEGMSCISVAGTGQVDCIDDDDCTDYVCNYVDLTCDAVVGTGVVECTTFEDCPQHKICDFVQQACVIVEGSGMDECGTYDDCFHDICDYSTFTCKERPVSEEGDACTEDSDCYEKICDYGQDICKKVEPGTPGTACVTYDDCVHLECCDMSCVVDDSPGTDECVTDLDCYYYACQDMSCVAVEGSGTDECSTDADCIDYVCQDISCVSVAGTGQVECTDDDDCRHYECDYVNELCKAVAEDGTDECVTWNDCLYCGDGEVTPPEECELPGTNDNTYCNQTTSECSGHKLGIRDGYGDCGVCICEYDEFDYSCVEGECGAECDEDTDCPCPKDGCIGPDWYEYPDHGVCTDDCMCDVDETPCDGPCKPSVTPDDPRCTRYVCDYVGQACSLVEGDGVDECSTYDDCFHDICDYQDMTCDEVRKNEIGDSCTKDDDCYYLGCADITCVTLAGQKEDECVDDTDCYHLVCEGMSCVAVPGEDTNECETSEDCYYYACDHGQQACSAVPGSLKDECVTYDDCVHNVCNYQTLTCDVDPSVGTDECQTFADCPQHKICDSNSQTCKIVQGTGVDECSTWSDCVHDICDYSTFTCEEEPITQSGDACTTNSDCFEKICDYNQLVCKKVQPGTPGTSCQTWADCAFCGDGEVSSPEECELPGTNNNLYCSQTTSECSGNKLGTRDAYGNCDSECGCVDDPFSYSCVEGQCGAECDSNDDCDCPADGCDYYNRKYPNYFDFPDYSECSLETCSCADCEPTESTCDPRCMGDCEVYVRLEHDQGNKANYDQYPHNPSGGTYDIWIVVETNGKCDGWRIPIKYWWCQCPNFDPDQEDIEYSVWPPKWNRLCTANAGNPNTRSLFCAPCEWRTLVLDVRGGDPGGEIMRVKTDVGLAEGTYQIDIAEYHDCYDGKAAVALGCAGHLEDQPTHLECSNKACQEVAGLGADQCDEDSDCYFYKCEDQACVKKGGTQTDQCTTDADCVTQTHTECNSMTCVDVSGSGTDECSLDCDCYHLECSNQQCVQVTGDGQDLCSVDSDCVVEDYHNECIGFMCQSVPGPGPDECFDNFECELPII